MAQNKKKKNRSNAALYKKQAMNEKLMLNAINKDRIGVFQQGENIGYTNATIIMLWLLHTEYGFGKMRLARFLNTITDFCEAYVLPAKQKHKEGEYAGIGLEDMCQALRDECKIDIDWKRGLIDIDGIVLAEEDRDQEILREGEQHGIDSV